MDAESMFTAAQENAAISDSNPTELERLLMEFDIQVGISALTLENLVTIKAHFADVLTRLNDGNDFLGDARSDASHLIYVCRRLETLMRDVAYDKAQTPAEVFTDFRRFHHVVNKLPF